MSGRSRGDQDHRLKFLVKVDAFHVRSDAFGDVYLLEKASHAIIPDVRVGGQNAEHIRIATVLKPFFDISGAEVRGYKLFDSPFCATLFHDQVRHFDCCSFFGDLHGRAVPVDVQLPGQLVQHIIVQLVNFVPDPELFDPLGWFLKKRARGSAECCVCFVLSHPGREQLHNFDIFEFHAHAIPPLRHVIL